MPNRRAAACQRRTSRRRYCSVKSSAACENVLGLTGLAFQPFAATVGNDIVAQCALPVHVHCQPPRGEQRQRHADHRRGRAFDAVTSSLPNVNLTWRPYWLRKRMAKLFAAAGLHDQKQTGTGGIGNFAAGFAGGDFLDETRRSAWASGFPSGVNMG